MRGSLTTCEKQQAFLLLFHQVVTAQQQPWAILVWLNWMLSSLGCGCAGATQLKASQAVIALLQSARQCSLPCSLT